MPLRSKLIIYAVVMLLLFLGLAAGCRGCHRQIDESYILFDAEGMIHLRHGKEPCGPVVEQPAKKANDA